MLSYSEKETVLSSFPNVKLSYENIVHKKVYNSDILLAIPEGRKSFAWFTLHNEKNVCLIMELTDNKQITNIKIVNVCFNSELVYGTIFYGTTFFHSYNKFFTIEDIFYYKGNDVSRYNWGKKFELLKTIFNKDIKQISLNNSFMVFGLPVLSNNVDDFTNKISELKYRINTIQFISFKRANNFLFMTYKSYIEEKQYKQIPANCEVIEKKNYIKPLRNNIKREVVFKIKPDIQQDIYNLYCLNNENKEEYYDIALVPDFNNSVMMNRLFRKIKENENLDALEESDDEEEFENENEDRFVYLDKTYNMVCQYNNRFKKWYPVRIADLNSKITNVNEIKKL